MRVVQLPLFPPEALTSAPPAAQETRQGLTPASTLGEAVEEFRGHMRQKGFSIHTINSFLGDLRILARYVGADRPIGRLATKDLKDFLEYLLYRRGKPCNAKSYARRLTTLKVFFEWLAEIEALPTDPAAPLVHQPVSTPLPQVLFDGEVSRLLDAGETLRRGEDPDARPLFLFQLLLTTGIKKAECMAIKLSDLDLSGADGPVLYVRYDHPQRKHKERKLRLGAEFAALLQEYRQKHHPQIHLFECTNRNLEYVLRDLGVRAGVDTPVSFETLRMTCAVRDYRGGVPLEALRAKLGLSHISWEETSQKIERLASSPL